MTDHPVQPDLRDALRRSTAAAHGWGGRDHTAPDWTTCDAPICSNARALTPPSATEPARLFCDECGSYDIRSSIDGAPVNSATEPAGLREPEFAWLIERGQPEGQSPTVWWADAGPGLMSYPTWTEDATKAYRFGSRAEADVIIDQKFTPPRVRGGPTARAVQHGFLDRSPEPVEGPRPWVDVESSSALYQVGGADGIDTGPDRQAISRSKQDRGDVLVREVPRGERGEGEPRAGEPDPLDDSGPNLAEPVEGPLHPNAYDLDLDGEQ